MTLTLMSPAFADGEPIPRKYTRNGGNLFTLEVDRYPGRDAQFCSGGRRSRCAERALPALRDV